jgi:hypothetical protein
MLKTACDVSSESEDDSHENSHENLGGGFFAGDDGW